MTDIGAAGAAPVPGRHGATARYHDADLVIDLVPHPAILHHGIVRASVVSFLVDVAAGVPLDIGTADAWSLTTDMTVRMLPVLAPGALSARQRVLRAGRRSTTSRVDVVDEDGATIAYGAIGFALVPRRADDPPKLVLTPEWIVQRFGGPHGLARPLREEAGIQVVDAAAGVVEIELTADVRNPAGTLQGAMVALVAEAAAEDLVATHFGVDAVVTDLDLRYLSRTTAGPVRTRARMLGDDPGATVEVELVDLSTDTVTTLVHARATTV